jgi:glycosyltransferase involved in cell wall biosynthesis
MKTLMILTPVQLNDMLKKGNVWYVRHYESYFDKVYVIYFLGYPHARIIQGNTTLISFGTGKRKIDLIKSPYRLFKYAKKINPTHYLTADLVFSWWTTLIMKLLLRAKIYLMPVCMPEQIYKVSAKSMSNLPIWLERLFTTLSFISADKVLTGMSFGSFSGWLKGHRLAQKKLTIIEVLVESIPSAEFFKNLQIQKDSFRLNSHKSKTFSLVYVGRLHREKLVDDLIRMMSVLKSFSKASFTVTLKLIGDGPERSRLEQLAQELRVRDLIIFSGYIANERLPAILLESNVFVSPLTGSSLREAALCGLPIIAYDMDWVSGFFKHEENILLVPPRNFEEMARHVIRLKEDEKLRKKLSQNAAELAQRYWSFEGLQESLSRAFADS